MTGHLDVCVPIPELSRQSIVRLYGGQRLRAARHRHGPQRNTRHGMLLPDMLSSERILIARNQRAVRLRAAAPADVPGVVALERSVVAAGEGVVKTPDDVQDQRAAELLSERIVSGHWVVAEWADDAVLIGCCRLDRHKASLIRHVATLSLEIHPDAQGVGIGRMLIECALDAARTAGSGPSDAVRRIELFVRVDNTRARRLYDSVGFQVEGVRRDFVRLPDGRFVDDLMMALLIQRP